MISIDGYINLGDYARKELGMTAQYVAYFVYELAGHPALCKDLRIIDETHGSCYHSIFIHEDDAPILKKRIEKWREGHCPYCKGPFVSGDEITSNENEDIVHVKCDEAIEKELTEILGKREEYTSFGDHHGRKNC